MMCKEPKRYETHHMVIKLCQYKVMQDRKNLSSGSNDRSLNLSSFGSLHNFGPVRRVLQRGDRGRLVNLRRMFIDSESSGLGLRSVGPVEQVTDSGGDTTAKFHHFDIRRFGFRRFGFQRFGIRLYGGCGLLRFVSDDFRSSGLT